MWFRAPGRVEIETHRHLEDNVNRLPVLRGRCECPLLYSINRGLGQTVRQRLEHRDILYSTGAIDNGIEDHDTADARPAGLFRIERLDPVERNGRLDVAPDAKHAL